MKLPGNVLAVLTALTLPALAACRAPTGGSESAETSEAEWTVHPTGTNDAATVTINLPPGITERLYLGERHARYRFEINGKGMKAGTPTQVAPSANACLQIKIFDDPGMGLLGDTTECGWKLTAGGSLSIDLGAVQITGTRRSERRADVFTLNPQGNVAMTRRSEAGRVPVYSQSLSDGGPLLLVPGAYEVSAQNAHYPAKPFTVAPLQQVDIDADNGDLSTLKLHFNAEDGWQNYPLANGMAQQLRCTNADGHVVTSHFSAWWREQLVLLDADTATCELVLLGGGLSTPVTLSRGQTTTVEFHRVNVDHVTLTDEGNRQVKGWYHVQRKDGDVWSAVLLPGGSVATGTGLDLPKGHYGIYVQYQAIAAVKDRWYEFDL